MKTKKIEWTEDSSMGFLIYHHKARSKMASSLENDMLCLVDSLKYLEDDSQQQMQALEFLADMCLQGRFCVLIFLPN